MKKIIGVTLISCPFIALLSFTVYQEGLLAALILAGVTLAIGTTISLGIILVND